MSQVTESEQQAWTRLIRVQRRLLEQVERQLKDAGMPPLVWYDVLLELERGEHGLRQYELAEAMLLSKHNLSRLLDRMQAEGLVQRESCPEDARGSIIGITAAGRGMRKAMWPVYGEAIHRIFSGRLEAEEVREFSNTLESLLN